MRGMTGGRWRERQPESVACGAADDPARTFARSKTQMGPGIASGPHSRLLARVRFGDCHSGWEVAKCLRVSRIPGIAASSARLPGSDRPACAFRPAFAATFPAVQKDRQSSIASLYRRPIPFLASRDRLRSHRPGAERWFRTEVRSRCSVFPSEGSGPLFRFPSASFEPGRSPARRFASGPLSSCPCDLPRRVSSLFSRVPKTAFGRLAHLLWGRIAYRSSPCFSKTCVPIRSRFLPPRQMKTAPRNRVAQDLFSSLIHRPRHCGG